MGCLLPGMGSKAKYIKRAASGESKQFSAIFVEVNELFKKHKIAVSTQKVLGIALQVYCQRRGKGTAEYRVYLGGEKFAMDWDALQGIKPATIDRNIRAYFDAKGEKRCASIQIPKQLH